MSRIILSVILIFTAAASTESLAQPVIASYSASVAPYTVEINRDAISPALYHGHPNVFLDVVGDRISVSPSAAAQVFTIGSAGDDADYPAFVGRLTDGTNEEMWAPTLFAGTAVGRFVSGTESSLFGVSPDLVGREIAGLRLTVEPFVITHPNASSTAVSGALGGPLVYRWDVVGVPEPATGAGMLLVAFAVVGRRQRTRNAV